MRITILRDKIYKLPNKIFLIITFSSLVVLIWLACVESGHLLATGYFIQCWPNRMTIAQMKNIHFPPLK